MPRYWDQVLFGTNSGVTTPNTPVKVDPNTKYLLVIANPGYQLKDRLDNLSAGATYATINGMITVPTNNTKPNNAYLVEEVVHSNGCAMINVGFYDDSDSIHPIMHGKMNVCSMYRTRLFWSVTINRKRKLRMQRKVIRLLLR